ncbi:hypothetical protein GCM10010435_83300 [Winogradskya consettensis]|uniref:Uncharacterized protein n=1 Tax=Winogradskya consettensis TaxID=113560 RepID=A0A919T0X2_9ACTN|nr:hypothetical protein [Actinoplanes consettensis]GIM82282.1 hypothetical protein Aco04nite_80800 [Actinoplanes consettensis]
MPTTTIESTPLDTPVQRRIAKRLTFWWRRHGVDVNHVLTVFRPAPALYSGPFPLPGPFALVTCVVAADRTAQFRREYAHAVRDALTPDLPAQAVFLSFHPTDPTDHFGPHVPNWIPETPVLEAPR